MTLHPQPPKDETDLLLVLVEAAEVAALDPAGKAPLSASVIVRLTRIVSALDDVFWSRFTLIDEELRPRP